MKTFSVILFVFALSVNALSQDADTVKVWKYGGNTSINITQVSLTNWAAGGESSVSGLGIILLNSKYNKNKISWENNFETNYGINKIGSENARKTDDKLLLSSKLGINIGKNWYFSGILSFTTQMFDGYNYPNDSVKISTLLAPGYLLASLAMDYKPSENFSLLVSPVTGKATIVNDQALADSGAFGVDPGDKLKFELGSYFKMFFKKEIIKNITFETKLDLFSDYGNYLATIDVNWEAMLDMKINEFFSAKILTNLIYDDDIRFDGTPKTQFKEVFGLGFSYKF
jgi:hypothetical protein